MADYKDIVKLALDSYHGTVDKYSDKQALNTLRDALIQANNGSTVLNFRDIRDGKTTGLFTIVEEIISKTTIDALQENDIFMQLVDVRNLAEGDQNKFIISDDYLFTVAEAADGTQGIRRQRVVGYNEVAVPTTLKAVRIYEELNRVLAGRVDFNVFIDRVSRSFQRKLLDDIYSAFVTATETEYGGAAFFPVAGNYSEDTLLTTIEHVEAAAGKAATLYGTKKALRAISGSIVGGLDADSKKEDLYTMGYCGKYFGSNVVALPQRHQVNSTNFQLSDKVIHIIAGDDKPIKLVYEGDTLIIAGDPKTNGDLTQEYFCAQKYGIAFAMAAGNTGMGCYQMT